MTKPCPLRGWHGLQAFLSATDYHRWHSPVAGTVVRAFTVGGTYYSEADAEGSDADDAPDSQAHLAHVSARAIVVTEADYPAIGCVAFVGVGMLEVSSCIVDAAVVPGHHLGKGDELGYFQFGGSTHCLVFEAGAVDFFATAAVPQPHRARRPRSLGAGRRATAGHPRSWVGHRHG